MVIINMVLRHTVTIMDIINGSSSTPITVAMANGVDTAAADTTEVKI